MIKSERGSLAGKKNPYKVKFIKESFNEKYTVEQGSEFEKTWTFRNDGSEVIPSETLFIYTNGEKFGKLERTLNRNVKPGEYFDISIEFKAPETLGNYCSFYRFSSIKGQKFGPKVWCDITVIEAESDIAKLQRDFGLLDRSRLHDESHKEQINIQPMYEMPKNDSGLGNEMQINIYGEGQAYHDVNMLNPPQYQVDPFQYRSSLQDIGDSQSSL